MNRRLTAFSFSAVVAISSCGTEPNIDDIIAVTSATVYTTPGVIDATVTNTASEPVYGMFCPRAIEHRVGDEWESTVLSEACATILIPLPPGEAYSASVSITGALPPGEYRHAWWLVDRGRRSRWRDPDQFLPDRVVTTSASAA